MTMSTFRVVIKNSDRNTESNKIFSSKFEAERYFTKYKPMLGDNVRLLQISDKEILSEK